MSPSLMSRSKKATSVCFFQSPEALACGRQTLLQCMPSALKHFQVCFQDCRSQGKGNNNSQLHKGFPIFSFYFFCICFIFSKYKNYLQHGVTVKYTYKLLTGQKHNIPVQFYLKINVPISLFITPA